MAGKTQFGLASLLFLTLFVDRGVKTFDISLGDVQEVLHITREIVTSGLEALEFVQKGTPEDQEYDFPFVKKMERRLKKEISIATKKIDDYQEKMELKSDENLEKILRQIPLGSKLDRSLHELTNYMRRVDDLYSNFHAYNESDKYERFTLEEFATICVSHASGALPDLLQAIHHLVVPGYYSSLDDSILILLAQSTKEAFKQICHEQQSPQQLLYNLYNTIAMIEMKGYAMMQFSYTLLQLYNNRTFNEEMQLATTKYRERIGETLTAVKTSMAYAPRELWRCDPSYHKEGSTYTELKQLVQGYIVNEVDLNEERTCKQNCAFYENTKVHGCYVDRDCKQQRRCSGDVVKCQYIDSDMWICPSAKSSTRRYEYIEYENGKIYGTKNTCKAVTKVDSWWRWLFWHCSYCMCYCDDSNSSSHRYFSLRDVLADVEINRVVTGIKFEKVNNIIHLVVEQGELLERAQVNNLTVEWKQIDNFTTRETQEGRDYHKLGWQKNAFDLDDLIAPEGHIVTGVRFRPLGKHLNFEIRVTPFNYTTGKLIKPLEKSTWLSNDNTDVANSDAPEKVRTELKLEKPGVPTKIQAPSQPDSRSNQFVNFVPTDFEKDAAQSTVPFIDIQPVITRPPFPLAGAGIYHKGRKGSGGFIAPRVITYDFKDHLKANLPPQRSVLRVNEIPFV